MSLKPMKVFAKGLSPNPWKVITIMEELSLPYEIEWVAYSDLKTPVYEKYNPNGRLPSIIDPNKNDFVLWESGAIIEYLTDNYDPEHKITPKTFEEIYTAKQYLHFQVSGQGPYFGQASWFKFSHPEKLPSAVERYVKEIRRVTGVLDGVLRDREFLVGGRVTYADIAFVAWFQYAARIDDGFQELVETDFPNFKRWNDALNSRPSVQKVAELKAKAVEDGN